MASAAENRIEKKRKSKEPARDMPTTATNPMESPIRTSLRDVFIMPYIKPKGSIVMTGSVTSLLGNKDLLDYSMTKGGIHAFARSLSTHLIPRGIRVNVVAPGPVWTPHNPADKSAERVQRFGGDTMIKRPAQPEEIAPAYVFLAAPTNVELHLQARSFPFSAAMPAGSDTPLGSTSGRLNWARLLLRLTDRASDAAQMGEGCVAQVEPRMVGSNRHFVCILRMATSACQLVPDACVRIFSSERSSAKSLCCQVNKSSSSLQPR